MFDPFENEIWVFLFFSFFFIFKFQVFWRFDSFIWIQMVPKDFPKIKLFKLNIFILIFSSRTEKGKLNERLWKRFECLVWLCNFILSNEYLNSNENSLKMYFFYWIIFQFSQSLLLVFHFNFFFFFIAGCCDSRLKYISIELV